MKAILFSVVFIYSTMPFNLAEADPSSPAICYVSDYIRHYDLIENIPAYDNWGHEAGSNGYDYEEWDHCYLGVTADYHKGIIKTFSYICQGRTEGFDGVPRINKVSWNKAHDDASTFTNSLKNSGICVVIVDKTVN